MFFLALKKAFAEDQDIQKLADEEFILLNLMVSKQWCYSFRDVLCCKSLCVNLVFMSFTVWNNR